MNEGFDQWLRLNKNLSGPISEWGRVTNEMYRRLLQQNLTLLGDRLELLSDQCRRLSTARKPEEFVSILKDCCSEGTKATVKEMETVLHSSMENMEEISKLCGSSLREPFIAATKTAERTMEKATEKNERHR